MDDSPLEIQSAIINYWVSENTGYDNSVAYENIPTVYYGTKRTVDHSSPFVKMDIRFTSSETVFKGTSSGSTLTRHRGVIFMEVYKGIDDLLAVSYDLATSICNTLERKRIGGVVTRNANLQKINLDDNQFVLVVEIPFLSS